MYCTNCGSKIVKNFCIHCGLMTNGVYVDVNKKKELDDLELYFDNDYDKILRNKNWIEPFIFGPVYIIGRNNIIIGLLLMLLDVFISVVMLVLNHAVLFYSIVTLLNVVYFFVNRVIWATIGNIIYIKLTNKKIENIRKVIKFNQEEEIGKQYKRDKSLLLFKYVILFVLYILFMLFVIGTIYNKLNLL